MDTSIHSSSRIREAREAFLKHDPIRSEKAHRLEAIEAPESHQGGMEFMKCAIYGGVDGIITLSSVIFSALGNHVEPRIIIALVIANAVADALSLALSDYISTKSELEYIESERQRELWEINNYPEGEKQEMLELYRQKGLSSEDCEIMVDCLARNKEVWLEVMMIEELGLIEQQDSPAKNGLVTFFAFVIFGIAPIVPKFISEKIFEYKINFFLSALSVTIFVLFSLGALKTKITGKSWIISGLETLLLGATATGLAFTISHLLTE